MQTNDAGIALIKVFEGLSLTAYPDAGYGWSRATIGYGHTSAAGEPTVTRGMTITEAEADAILRRDLRVFEDAVAKLVTVPINENQHGALVSLTFNIGATSLAGSTLLRRLNRGAAPVDVAAQFARWNRSGGKVLAGLTRRRAAERDLFLTPVASAAQPPVVVAVRPVPKPSPETSLPGTLLSWVRSFLKG